tara:strand:- start:3569 stop:3913 length:345 start_codon:yes stop_codon:yes gene_type:complete
MNPSMVSLPRPRGDTFDDIGDLTAGMGNLAVTKQSDSMREYRDFLWRDNVNKAARAAGNPLEASEPTLADTGGSAFGLLGAGLLAGGALTLAYKAASSAAAFAWGKLRGRDRMD